MDPSDFDPDVLKPCWTDGNGNLKPGCTTDQYTGGTPGSGDLKPSLVDASGNLKKGLLLGDQLKPSLLRAGEEEEDAGPTPPTATLNLTEGGVVNLQSDGEVVTVTNGETLISFPDDGSFTRLDVNGHDSGNELRVHVDLSPDSLDIHFDGANAGYPVLYEAGEESRSLDGEEEGEEELENGSMLFYLNCA